MLKASLEPLERKKQYQTLSGAKTKMNLSNKVVCWVVPTTKTPRQKSAVCWLVGGRKKGATKLELGISFFYLTFFILVILSYNDAVHIYMFVCMYVVL